MQENNNPMNTENKDEIRKENIQNKEEKKTAADLILKKLEDLKNNSEKKEGLDLKKINEEVKKEAKPDTEIEDSDVEKDEEKTNNLPNYKEYSRQQLIERLNELFQQENIDLKEVEIIKNTFYTKRNAEIIEKRNKFVEEGGKKEEFKHEEDHLDEVFKVLLEKYKNLKREIHEKEIAQQERNLEIKNQIIDKIEGLIEKGETLHNTFEELHKLQDEWKNTGAIPQKEEKALNERYNFTLQKFYDWVKINKELRDFDLKRNLDLKENLCVEAEALLIEPKITIAYKKLQNLYKRWNEIGPVPREYADSIYKRFKEVSSTINKRHYDYFQRIKKEQKDNLKAKELLCEEAEKIAEKEYEKSVDWRKKSEEIDELMKLWRLIGFAPKRYNNQIFERFITARKKFFEKKKLFYQTFTEELEKNLKLKKELIAKVEKLKDSEDWQNTSKKIIEIQKKWKNIGPVPKENKDEIWKEFNEHCNYFFEKMREFNKGRKEREKENLKKKEELIEKIKNFEVLENQDDNIEALKAFQNEWNEIGFVPFKEKNKIYAEYQKSISELMKKMSIDDKKYKEFEIQQKIDNILSSNDPKYKLRKEIEFIKNKIDKLHNETLTIENNLRYFIESENSSPLLDNLKNKVEKLKKQKENYEIKLVEYFKALKSLNKNK